MIPAARLEKSGRRPFTIDRSAWRLNAAQGVDRPEIRLIVGFDVTGCIAGVVGRTDIVSRISHCTGCTCTEAVAPAMTGEVTICAPSEPVEDIWNRMKQTGFMHLPAIDAERAPLGVLAARDVLETLLADREHEESLLMDYVTGTGYR